jgi:acetylornithine deacetylase/succinyl-diaminopimelate desuccinylase-like protein
MSSLKDVYDYIDEHRDEFVEVLRRFLRMPSVSTDIEDCWSAAKVLHSIMTERGIESKIFPLRSNEPMIGGPVVYADIPGEKKKTLLGYAHYDDKPAVPLDEWVTPPWSADLREGPHGPTIYARGAADNKSGCIAFVLATEAFLRTRGKPPVSLKLVFEGEEEIGSTHLEDWAVRNKEMLEADGMHCLDGWIGDKGRPTVGIHGKAVLYVELWARGPKENAHSGRAAFVVNPLWRLVFALASLKDLEKDKILVNGWYENIREPSKEDLEFLKEEMDEFDEEEIKKKFGVEGSFPGNRTGFSLLKEAKFGATASICGIYGGFTIPGKLHTIIPKEAYAKIDFRCPPNLDPYNLFERLKEHLIENGFDDIEPVLISARPNPWFTSPTEDIVQAMIRARDILYPEGLEINYDVSAEGVFRVALGIPAAMTGFGNPDCKIHAPNENLAVPYFIKGVKFAATIMHEFSKL